MQSSLLWMAVMMCWLSFSSTSAYDVCATGDNSDGELGLGDNNDESQLTLVSSKEISSLSYTAIAAGLLHSLVLSNSGRVYSAGWSAFGQLGLGYTTYTADRWTPTLIAAGGLSSVSITEISAGLDNSFLISNAGFVYSTGLNDKGALGLGDTTDRWTPTLVTAGGLSSVSIVAVSAGIYHSLMLSNGGRVYAAGENVWGQFGLGDATNRYTPTLVTAGGLASVSITAISAGEFHSLLLSNSGFVYATGWNELGQLGLGDTIWRYTPALITTGGLSSVSISTISAGSQCSFLLSNAGRAYGTGRNAWGQLGLGDATDRWTPTLITGGGLLSVSITAISAGTFHSIMLSNNSFAYSTGYNGNGQLGLGDTTDRWTPTLISPSISIKSIAAGGAFSLVLTRNHGCALRTNRKATNYLYVIGVVAAVAIIAVGALFMFWRRKQKQRTILLVQQPDSTQVGSLLNSRV